MEKIKRFIDCYVPTETCNLRCHYCYITQKRKFNAKLLTLTHSPVEIRKALSKDRLGGTCLINMCAGGETLLAHDLLDVIYALLLEGHYISIVTNGTLTDRFNEIAAWPEALLRHVFFKFSFHFLEMKRLGWTDRFFENVQTIKNTCASYTVEVTPSDELIPYIDELKETCMKYMGTLCHVTIARNDLTDGIDVLSEHPFEDYKKIWGQFDSALFNYKASIFYKKRKGFCYAGDWSANLNLESGRLSQCYRSKEIDNIYAHPDSQLHFEAIGHACPLAHCYNGHAFLALGTIPELVAPTYAEERNRICPDGSEWLKPEMKAFLSSKLYESNSEYNILQKMIADMKQRVSIEQMRKTKAYNWLRKVKHKYIR